MHHKNHKTIYISIFYVEIMRSDKVKGIICTLSLCLLLFTGTIATAAPPTLDITTLFSLQGEGVTYRVLEAESEDGLNGIKYAEEWITPGLGIHGNTTIEYEELFFFTTGNTSYLSMETTTTYANLQYETRAKNYILGAAQCYKNHGNSSLSLIYQADNMTSAIAAYGEIEGKTVFTLMATDHNNSIRLYKDSITHIGKANINLENVIMCIDYPAAGEGDWMECP
jgi:hypothetical protein